MTDTSRVQAWVSSRERGSLPFIRLGVWTTRRLGRRVARLLLYPLCLYFFVSSPSAARASKTYLRRVLERPPRLRERFAHFLTFARCLLDRVFLLSEQTEAFEITVHGEEILLDIAKQGGGCMLFGAHFGSFEVARALGRRHHDFPISLLMYEENAQKVRAALAAINPNLATEVIGLGRMDSLIAVAERLRQGHFIGVLADRNLDGKDMVRFPFLGATAGFPAGPFRVAMMLQRPVVMMAGIYRGGRRYEVHFETLAEAATTRPPDAQAWLDDVMTRYVTRLEDYCREAPYNWFNFYDFWA
jgi:predicted LPLAT superfamily acyltransferase